MQRGTKNLRSDADGLYLDFGGTFTAIGLPLSKGTEIVHFNGCPFFVHKLYSIILIFLKRYC